MLKILNTALGKVYHGIFPLSHQYREGCFIVNHFNFSFERITKRFVINYISVSKIRPDEEFAYC